MLIVQPSRRYQNVSIPLLTKLTRSPSAHPNSPLAIPLPTKHKQNSPVPPLHIPTVHLPYRCPPNTNKTHPFPLCTSQQSTGHHAAALSTAYLYRRTSRHCLGNVRVVNDLIRPVPLMPPCLPVRIIRQFINQVLSLRTQPEHLNPSDAHTEVGKPQRHDRGVSGCHSGVPWGAEAVTLGDWFPRRFGG
jgi:hypothetical protein